MSPFETCKSDMALMRLVVSSRVRALPALVLPRISLKSFMAAVSSVEPLAAVAVVVVMIVNPQLVVIIRRAYCAQRPFWFHAWNAQYLFAW